MLKLLLFLVFIVTFTSVACFQGLILGTGQWLVQNILHCKDFHQQEVVFDISRRKMNRTHDCFHVKLLLEIEINTTYGAEIDVYQEVDGGFKFYQTIKDDCACTFLMKHAEENVKRFLRMAKVDPTDCPLQPATLEVEDFVMDYTELPKTGVYGKYEAYAYFVRDGVRIGCVSVLLNFEEEEDDDDDDDGGGFF